MILNKKSGKLFVLLASVSASNMSLAGSMGALMQQSQYTPIATFTVGPDFVNPGHAHTLTLLPPFQNYYTNGNAAQTVTDIGGFVGVERLFNDKLSVQVGVSVYGDTNISPQGNVWQFATPEFEDLSYIYHIQHTRVMATTKLLTTPPKYPALHPYISGEIGGAFNNTSNYQEIPLEIGAVPTAPFSNHNQTSFAWGAGIGADFNINNRVRIGAGYQFSDLGTASLGPTSAALTTETLSLSHIYANQLRFQLTVLI